MTGWVRRGMATAALALAAATASMWVSGPAQAHGATQNPVSRAFACGPEGASKAMAACKAAIAAGGSLDAWDTIRVANVAGKDRTVIPDGKLCSGGIDRFKGLDLPRADWPSTNLTAGASYSFSYRATIAHPGTFRMYLTKSSYDPTKGLHWADLDTVPFLTATNPTLQGGTYVMKGKLPTGRTGRQLIYTIWQNSGPDTYYSCSDVVFPAAAQAGAATATTKAASSAPPVTPTVGATAPSTVAVAPVADSRPATGAGLPVVAVVAVAIPAAAIVVGILALVLRRRRTQAGHS